MKKIIFYLSKLIIILQKGSERGTSFPGKFALKYNPDLLKEFLLPEKRVFISGTNGKTSTANSIANIMAESGQEVCHNAKGANMIQGITTTLLKQSNKNYLIKADSLVLEIDELTMPKVFEQITPHTIILTNLFNDQIDRYGDKWQLAKKLSQELPNDITLFANGDDPTLVWLVEQLRPRKVIYFGLDSKFTAPKQIRSKIADYCPYCGDTLNYTKRYYEDLGKFNCTCGFHSPDLNYIAEGIDLKEQNFTVQGQVYPTPYKQLYLIYNMLTSISYALEEKIDPALVSSVLSAQTKMKGRFEYLKFNQHKAWLNLVKNPAGLNQSLSFIDNELKKAEKQSKKINVFLAFNNQPVDGVDDTWLEEANFSVLDNLQISKIYLAGSLSGKTKSLLNKLPIAKEKIEIVDDLPETIQIMKASNYPSYFLSNFTMLESVRSNIIASK